jgi:hypothetical protein
VKSIQKKKQFVVEQKTIVFRFFVDLDYKAEESLPDYIIIELCQAMNRATGHACLVALAKPRPVDNLIKTGVHIHWPDLHVNKTQAMHFRSRIILELTDNFPGRNWSEDIDPSVYQGSGLRMLWSFKSDPDSTPYVPWKRIGASVTDLPTEPAVDLLNLFSIRIVGGDDKKETVELPESADKLEEFIRKNMEGQSQTNIQKVFKAKKGNDEQSKKEVYCVQTNSKYCENIKGDHKSNHIWLSVYRQNSTWTIRQKCLDPDCNPGEKFTFTGRPHILPPSIVEELTKDGVMAQDCSPSISIYDLFSIPRRSNGTIPGIH